MTDVVKISERVNGDNQNINQVKCQFCPSLMLLPTKAVYEENEFPLPLMHQKRSQNAEELDTENLKDFWVVDDMFTFENIGFSNTVGDFKYLICADCEMGPVGYHKISNKKSYIAIMRVKHEN